MRKQKLTKKEKRFNRTMSIIEFLIEAAEVIIDALT